MNNNNNNIRSAIGILLAFLFLSLCFTPQMQTLFTIPGHQKLVVGETSSIDISLPNTLDDKLELVVAGLPSTSVFAAPEDPPVKVNRNEFGYEIVALRPGTVDVKLKLLGHIPIRSIKVESVPTRRVVPGGHSIGVALQSKGIMVVGYAPIDERDKFYPAKDQGVQIGDLIMEVNGQSVYTETDLAKIIDKSSNKKLTLSVKRKDKIIEVPIEPIFCSETQRNRIGLFVRDGVVGVGTLSFWDPQTHGFAALGHVIIDADTRQGIDVLQGKIMSASVQTIKPARPGRPGEKIGVFNEDGPIEGNIIKNSYFGLYGTTDNDVKNSISEYTMEVGYAHQIEEGKAEILTVVNGDDIERFEIEIERVYPQRQNGKGMIIKVTDPRLLSLTGGIVQGMSGSPIIQNSRIVGAVTHVFLNDPERGYGVFMDNMLSEIEDIGQAEQKISTN
ncbi:Stage IV sporulation protein B [Candidatus Syntrophocurvum alkaliphilum]|uniref:Stage IV sporulation protein B n=1 Tax=Candidatus Syntrophocurvum alkaliphilum TaxID=2293317 RepID=A0A6I6DCC8_9FIRM|nr:SpoIVB peptidase [Candidatus Syntrophocurvum alkaliphilum]QGT98975.1 Stage IV sporulation protein B [Candidatus Syntrophocurvum alkaliphilum]